MFICIILFTSTFKQFSSNIVPYSRKFSQYVYFAVKSLIRIFADKISRMAYSKASFQLKMMLSSEFPHTKFSLLINHPQKFHTTKKFPAIRYVILTELTVFVLLKFLDLAIILCHVLTNIFLFKTVLCCTLSVWDMVAFVNCYD